MRMKELFDIFAHIESAKDNQLYSYIRIFYFVFQLTIEFGSVS